MTQAESAKLHRHDVALDEPVSHLWVRQFSVGTNPRYMHPRVPSCLYVGYVFVTLYAMFAWRGMFTYPPLRGSA